ncbi:MAG: hypothetical protein WD875_15330 [Pirellulales bacterium]
MKEIREIAEKYLWLAALVAGGFMILRGFVDYREQPGLAVGAILGGSLLVATALVCVTFERRSDR